MIRQHVSTVLVAVAVLGSATFVVLYHRRSAWWRSESGWWLMSLGVSEFLWMSLALIGRLLHVQAGWFPWVVLASFALSPVTIWWRCRLFLKTQPERAEAEG